MCRVLLTHVPYLAKKRTEVKALESLLSTTYIRRSGVTLKSGSFAALLVVAIILSAAGGYLGGTTNSRTLTQTETTIMTKTDSVTNTLTTTASYSTTLTHTQTVTLTTPPGRLNLTFVITCHGCTNSSNNSQYYSGTIVNGTSSSSNITALPGNSVGPLSYSFVAHPAQYLSGTWSISWQVILYSPTGMLEVKVYEESLLFSDKTADPTVGYLSGQLQIAVK